jgi:hypothetical protein
VLRRPELERLRATMSAVGKRLRLGCVLALCFTFCLRSKNMRLHKLCHYFIRCPESLGVVT